MKTRIVGIVLLGMLTLSACSSQNEVLSEQNIEDQAAVDTSEDTLQFSYKVYCQSYSTSISEVKDCFVMALPMKIQHHYEITDNDGVVSEESAQFGCYKGNCLDIPVSHVQIIDLFSKKSQKEQIYSFYKRVCLELSKMGF